MSLSAGTRLGPYEIVAPIGAGGMGEVYCATDTSLKRQVALKVLPPDVADNPERVARFQREAEVLAALNHPNIAHLYGLERSTSTIALVMELVEGPTLADRIVKGSIPVDEALAIARQIADAVEAAHEQGIVHRDLKPANIKVKDDGTVKVLDFGLAKATESASGVSSGVTNSPTITSPALMTAVGMLLGTAAYMSPEQAKGRAADRRSDMWAFGCVLYEMLTGHRAFEGEDVSDTLAFILTKEPDWSALPPTTPASIRRLLRRLLQKDRSRRLESAADSRLEIDEALTSGTADATPATLTFHRWPWIGAVAATLVVGALSGALIVSRFRQPADERVLRLQIDPPPGGQFVLGGNGPIIGSLAISPDGKTVAFPARVSGKTALWIRPLDASAASLLPGTEDAAFPMWAPDGRSLAFFVKGKLQRIEIGNSKPVTIADNAGPTSGGTSVRSGSWGSDGSILFPVFPYGLLRVAAAGGTPTPITRTDYAHGEVSEGDPQFLPAGRILFAVLANTPEKTGTYAAPIATPTSRIKVSDDPAHYAPGTDGTDYLLWQRGGTLMAQRFDSTALKVLGEPRVLATETDDSRLIVSISASGVLVYAPTRGLSQLNWVDRAGNVLAAVGEPERTFMFRISPDDRQVVVQPLRDVNLWSFDAARGLPKRLTSGAGPSRTHPIWSPDSRTVVFWGGPASTIYRKRVMETGDEEPVTDSPQRALPTDWSADGRWIIDYRQDQNGKYDLWIVPVTADGTLRRDDKPRPYLRTPFNERFGRFSPGPMPRWVAYQSDESGQNEIYIDRFPEPGAKVRISAAGGTFPQWRADGRELFYLSPDFRLMAVSVNQTTDSIEPSPPRELFTIAAPANYMSPYEVSRDGQRFLVLSAHEEPTQSLTVIVNWPALLKKSTGAP
jgi:eukaryotic-like serine/threonine-protein kinase